MRRVVLVLTFAMAACRAAPPSPPPWFAAATSGEAITVDAGGHAVAARRWAPAAPRAAVLVLPAEADPGAQVVAAAEQLAAAGALVVAAERTPDLAPPVVARALLARLRAEVAAPLFVVGRGDAGLVALRLVQEDAGPIAGVAVAAPRLTGSHIYLMTGEVSAAAVGLGGVDPVVPLWDQVAAIDEPVLVVAQDEPRALAVARDLVDRSGSPDRAVVAHAEPMGAPAAAAIAAWIAQRVAGTATASRPAPAAPGRHGVAVGLLMGWNGTRREDGDLGDDLHTRGLVSYGRIGWAGVIEQDDVAIALMPIGLGARVGVAGQLALVGGLGLRVGGNVVPVEASAELPLGRHLRGLATARALWELDDDDDDEVAAGIDDVQVRVGLRILGDRRLWLRAAAGAGVYLAGTYRRTGDVDTLGIEIGYHLWGGQ